MRNAMRGLATAGFALVLTAVPALAEDAVHPNGVVIGAGSGSSGGGNANTTVDPTNGGVAGTGMGKTHKSDAGPPSMNGTGQSVPGSPGQGIGNVGATGAKN